MRTEDDEPRGTRHRVDVTVPIGTMVEIRDELRAKLVRNYHLLQLSSRANRKAGNLELARKQQGTAERTLAMIWYLDNPMEGLTPPESEAEGK